ncbi:hypothetical protein HID58_013117 [Brassica napus]|uniref:Uncharacterized protein n=1 Tax=Brassica napus TaxID=3708 RepID=A0ABQ8E326_BRANA|nr:hypothetical protein HID58_013117 [Brassica napus]
MMDARPEKPEKRASLSPQSLDIVSPESSAITTGWNPPVCSLGRSPDECNFGSEQALEEESRFLFKNASVNEVERESKLFSGTGEIADSAQLSRSCEQNRDYEVLQFPASNSGPFVEKGNVYAVP